MHNTGYHTTNEWEKKTFGVAQQKNRILKLKQFGSKSIFAFY
jgi:hypothetical protein